LAALRPALLTALLLATLLHAGLLLPLSQDNALVGGLGRRGSPEPGKGTK
jgi:hypothetical protein